jgi:hypothetical protein
MKIRKRSFDQPTADDNVIHVEHHRLTRRDGSDWLFELNLRTTA